MNLSVIPLISEKKNGTFSLFEELKKTFSKNEIKIENGDIIVISSKFVSISQNRVLSIKNSKVCKDASDIAKKYNMNKQFTEIVFRESEKILGGVSGFVMSTIDGVLAPNAGIDRSNSNETKIILYPNEPFHVAEELKRKIFLEFDKHVGIIIVDSRLMPARIGTAGITIACAGIKPTNDLRGEKDLSGNPLKVTFQATSDNIATIANHMMGEGDELQPVTIVRNSNCKLTNRKIMPNELIIPYEQCVYIRSFSN